MSSFFAKKKEKVETAAMAVTHFSASFVRANAIRCGKSVFARYLKLFR